MRSQGIHHLELFTDEPDRMVGHFRDGMGFTEHAGTASSPGCHTSVLLTQHEIRLVVSAPDVPSCAAAEYVARHGEGVADIAIGVPNARTAFRTLVRRGARAVAEPAVRELPGADPVVVATVGGPGDLVHSLVEQPTHARPGNTSAGMLTTVDHIALCVPSGQLESTARFYREVFDFQTIFEENIVVGDQGMFSKVVRNGAGDITFTLIEPDATRSPGQIDKFVDGHGGPGVQHVAFATTTIATTVRALRERSLEFLTAPDRYYSMLTERLPELTDEIRTLRELNVLVDRDHWGYLLQIFTKSVHPAGTLFFELIERRNAKTFGSGNIRALYSAVEQELLSGLAPDRP